MTRKLHLVVGRKSKNQSESSKNGKVLKINVSKEEEVNSTPAFTCIGNIVVDDDDDINTNTEQHSIPNENADADYSTKKQLPQPSHPASSSVSTTFKPKSLGRGMGKRTITLRNMFSKRTLNDEESNRTLSTISTSSGSPRSATSKTASSIMAESDSFVSGTGDSTILQQLHDDDNDKHRNVVEDVHQPPSPSQSLLSMAPGVEDNGNSGLTKEIEEMQILMATMKAKIGFNPIYLEGTELLERNVPLKPSLTNEQQELEKEFEQQGISRLDESATTTRRVTTFEGREKEEEEEPYSSFSSSPVFKRQGEDLLNFIMPPITLTHEEAEKLPPPNTTTTTTFLEFDNLFESKSNALRNDGDRFGRPRSNNDHHDDKCQTFPSLIDTTASSQAQKKTTATTMEIIHGSKNADYSRDKEIQECAQHDSKPKKTRKKNKQSRSSNNSASRKSGPPEPKSECEAATATAHEQLSSSTDVFLEALEMTNIAEILKKTIGFNPTPSSSSSSSSKTDAELPPNTSMSFSKQQLPETNPNKCRNSMEMKVSATPHFVEKIADRGIPRRNSCPNNKKQVVQRSEIRDSLDTQILLKDGPNSDHATTTSIDTSHHKSHQKLNNIHIRRSSSSSSSSTSRLDDKTDNTSTGERTRQQHPITGHSERRSCSKPPRHGTTRSTENQKHPKKDERTMNKHDHPSGYTTSSSEKHGNVSCSRRQRRRHSSRHGTTTTSSSEGENQQHQMEEKKETMDHQHNLLHHNNSDHEKTSSKQRRPRGRSRRGRPATLLVVDHDNPHRHQHNDNN